MHRLYAGIAVVGMSVLALTACGRAATSAQGDWGASEQGEAQLTFTGEGMITGTDGCNRLTGTWEQDGDDVTLSGLASTLMACPDVDVWLVDPASAFVDGDTMRFFDSSGTEIGELARQ